MTVLIVAEKPSAARNFAKALGGMTGSFEGTTYKIAALRGHLYEFVDVSEQVPPTLKDRYKTWSLGELPWDEAQFAWKRKVRGDAASVARDLKSAAQGVDEIVCATDLDPSGEGALLFAEPILEQGIKPKRLTRMYFTDEAEKSIQTAFRQRKPIPGNDITQLDEYQKAITRSQFDFLTQQHTRIASLVSGQRGVLRQGRLKSAMLLLVGDQLRAHHAYVKTVSYQNRFRDDHDVLYTDPEQPIFKTEAEARAAMAPLRRGSVIVDSKTMKQTAPPRLLDLAGLASRLAPKGAKPAEVLKVYQQMYEAQVVSYPRTEDRVISKAQFDEMLPLVDQIAGVVGVDIALLTHRAPRGTHVKDGGAHGANRPGLKVPASLASIERSYGKLGRAIYEELARSFLAMLAEDYRYEAQVGHVEPHPSFVGRVSVPKSPGWKRVFKADAVDADEAESATGLGSQAAPCVFEVIPKRPEHPTMAWLMKQLEKWDVGTGATRTSTYSELTRSVSATNKYPLMVDTRGKTGLTTFGEQGYRLLPGTRIGDLASTAWVYARMKAVAEGATSTKQVIGVVADWVRHDIDVMGANAITMRKELNLSNAAIQKERHQGVMDGASVTFTRDWAGHRFTDVECAALLRGEVVSASDFIGKSGKKFEAHGRLGKGTYNGKPTFGFQLMGFGPPPDASGKPQPPTSWCGYTFSAAEKKKLADGAGVAAEFTSKSGKTFSATVHFKDDGGNMKLVPTFAS